MITTFRRLLSLAIIAAAACLPASVRAQGFILVDTNFAVIWPPQFWEVNRSAIEAALTGKQGADADLVALAGLSGAGMLARTGDGTAAVRTLTGDSEIVVANGSGASGNPTLSLGAAIARVATMAASYQPLATILSRLSGIGLGTAGDVLIRDANGWTNLAKGTDGQVLKLASGLPAWGADATGGSGSSISNLAQLIAGVSTNDLIVWDGVAWVRTNKIVLEELSATTLTLSSALGVASGGTGSTTAGGARTALGLGTMATEAASSFAATTGATFSGDISVPEETYGTGWNGSTEVPTKNAIYDKIEDALSTRSYALSWSGIPAWAPLDSTTYYVGLSPSFSTVYTNAAWQIPAAGTVKSLQFRFWVPSTGSSENVVLSLVKNGSTEFGLSTNNFASGIVLYNATNLTQSVSAGDTLAIKLVSPAWATNPSGINGAAAVFIQ